MEQFGSQMQSFASAGEAVPQRPLSQPHQVNGTAKPATGPPPKPPHNGCADVKPRLTKEQHDILEAHFQQHHKPSTSTKKGFAETLGVPVDKINVSNPFTKQWNETCTVADMTRRTGSRTAGRKSSRI